MACQHHFVQHRRMNDVEHYMPLSPFDYPYYWTTWSVVCPHGPLEAHMVGRCRSFHAIFAFGQHTWSDNVWLGMPSSPLIAYMVVRHRAWHDIITLGHDTRLDSVGVTCHHRLWDAHTLGRCWARQWSHRPWAANTIGWCRALNAIIDLKKNKRLYYIGNGIPSRSWTTHMVGQRRAFHAIIAFGQHTLMNDIGWGMASSSLDNKNGQTT